MKTLFLKEGVTFVDFCRLFWHHNNLGSSPGATIDRRTDSTKTTWLKGRWGWWNEDMTSQAWPLVEAISPINRELGKHKEINMA